MKKVINCLTAGVILLSSSTSVLAYDYNVENANKLKQQIENSYTWKSIKVNEKSEILKIDGEISVSPMDGYFSVSYPNIQIDLGDNKIDFGVAKLNMIPAVDNGENGDWKFTAKIPDVMKIMNGKSEQVGQITIGKQLSQGIWNVNTGITPLMNMAYFNVKIEYNPKTASAKDISVNANVKDIIFKSNLEKNSDNTWSGPSFFKMNDTSINVGNDHMVSIDDVTANTKYVGLNIDNQIKMIDSLQDMGPDGVEATEKEALNFISKTIDALDSMYKDSESNLEVSGFKFKSMKEIANVSTEGGKPFELSIGKFDAVNNTYDMNSNNTEVILQNSIKDIKVDGVADVYKNIIPADINFDVKVNKLPMQKIFALLGDGVSDLVENPENSDKLKSMSASIPSLLAEYGTALVIKNSFIDSKNLKIKIEGDALADKSAAKIAVAKLLFRISGITDTLADLSQNTPKDEVSMMMSQQAQMGLGMLQAMGKTETNGDVIYKLELTKDGQMLMNGNSMGGMMGGGMGAPLPVQ